MRFPYDKWLRYQLQFTEFTHAEIQSLCENYGFFPPTAEDLKFLKRELRETRPRRYRANSAKALAWVRSLGLWGLYTSAPAAVAAKALLNQSRVRQTIEYLLAANTPAATVADYIQQQQGVTVEPATIESYARYFWDVDSMSSRQWNKFCQELIKDNDKEGYVLREVYQMRSPEFALWKLGHRVELDRKGVFEAMFHEATMRFMDTSQMKNGQGTALAAKSWADIMLASDDKLAGTADATQKVLVELKELRVALGRRDISSLEKLQETKRVKTAN